ncbi:IS3 family transposase [Rubritalea tangerina]
MRKINPSYSVSELCAAFGVSRSGFQHYSSDHMTQTRLTKIKLTAEIKAVHNDKNLRVYGSPRMVSELNDRGFNCSENTVAKLMRELGIEARRAKPFKPKTTKVDHAAKYSSNKLESQHASRFGETLVSDITYIRTKEGWLYLAVVMDLFSRTIIGHQTGAAMPAEIVTRSLEQGVLDWMLDTKSSTFHSDRGTQYTSQKLRSQLASLGMDQSMSGKGNCYDNACCESFFSSLKRELMPDSGYFETRREARIAIFQHIEGFYNTRRKHSSLGNLSPVQFLELHSNLEKVA